MARPAKVQIIITSAEGEVTELIAEAIEKFSTTATPNMKASPPLPSPQPPIWYQAPDIVDSIDFTLTLRTGSFTMIAADGGPTTEQESNA